MKGICAMRQLDDEKEVGYWLKHFLAMSAKGFAEIDQSKFTVAQQIAFNYAKLAQSDPKIADKAVKTIGQYDSRRFIL